MKFRHSILITATVLLALLAAPGSLWSWGRLAHRVSAKLAESRLTPGARAAIRELLEPDEKLADISVWADHQKEIPYTASWHFVNVPITESRYDSKSCQKKGCVVSKIEDYKRVLMNPNKSRKDKRQALKFLMHLIQDLHQPLHIGDNGDRGGKNLQVRWFGTGTNLHRPLDSQIINRYSRNEVGFESNRQSHRQNQGFWEWGQKMRFL